MNPEEANPPSQRSKSTRTFVSLTGPAGNIGDALIRRETLNWARDTSNSLVAYVGDAPDIWLTQLGLPPGTLVLRSKRSVLRWLWLIASAPPAPALFFEAGEVPLGRGNVLREIVFLAETLLVGCKGGVVVRPPRGIRGVSQPALSLHALAARRSRIALWRDARSARQAKSQNIAPDIGFAGGLRLGCPWEERGELIISLRGQRPFPNESWIEAVRFFAATHGLIIRTVVQVREDESRARELASALGCHFEPWEIRDSLTQERLLRRRYENAKLVISDRMHVLILAAMSGAIPVELVPSPTGKITDAFATVGLDDVSLDSAKADSRRIVAFLDRSLERTAHVRARVARAAEILQGLEGQVRETIRSSRER